MNWHKSQNETESNQQQSLALAPLPLFDQLSTSAEPDAMEAGGSTFTDSPRERAAISQKFFPEEADRLFPSGCKCGNNGGGDCDWCQIYYNGIEEDSPQVSSERTVARSEDGPVGCDDSATYAQRTAQSVSLERTLPTATAEGSPIPTPHLGQRGVADGAASSLEIRLSKKWEIHHFFAANLGRHFSTYECHAKFGTAFRSRVSELNRDSDLRISILNETKTIEGQEHSYYWSALR